MEQAPGKMVLITYQHRSTGRHTVTGAVTKKSYGYRKRGDRFKVYEADMKVRPDLFRPVNAKPKPEQVIGLRSARARAEMKIREQNKRGTAPPAGKTLLAPDAPPPPKHVNPQADPVPPPEEVEVSLSGYDWAGTRVNKRQIAILSENGINYLSDLDKTNEARLMGIKGIGESTIRALYKQWNKYYG